MHSFTLILALAAAFTVVSARQMVPEHFRRKVGNENPAVLQKFAQLALPNGQAGTIAGAAVSTLLAGADACAQQNAADDMIDAVKATGDAALISEGIAIAQEFRQSERNTQPDFKTAGQPDTCSLFCQEAPKNAELDGLSQTQSAAADGSIFFSAGAIVKAGSPGTTPPAGSPNTCGNGGGNNASAGNAANATADNAEAGNNNVADGQAAGNVSAPAQVTVTQTITAQCQATAAPASNNNIAAPPAAAAGANVQTFTGNLGADPVPVENVGGGRPFVVNGNTFVGQGPALQRSCAIQNNACANAANSGGDFSVSDCKAQEDECNAAASA